MRYAYAFGLLLAATLTGCHRDAEGPTYDLTGTYTAATTLSAAKPISMYTIDGEVNNPAAVMRYLAQRTWLKDYFSATDVPVTGDYVNTLTFRANHRATLTVVSPTRTDSIRFEVTNEQPNSLLLQELDSVNSFGSAGTGSVCRRNEELASYVKSVYPSKRCVAVSPATGYGQFCKTRLVRVVGAHGSQLYRPYFSWAVQSERCGLAYSGEWNTFNPAVLNHLAAGDTLVVQEREIALHR